MSLQVLNATTGVDTEGRVHTDRNWIRYADWGGVHELLKNPFQWAKEHLDPGLIHPSRNVVVLDSPDTGEPLLGSYTLAGVKGAAFILARGVPGEAPTDATTSFEEIEASANLEHVNFIGTQPDPKSPGFGPSQITLAVGKRTHSDKFAPAFVHFHLPTKRDQEGFDRLAGFALASSTSSTFLPDFLSHHRNLIKVEVGETGADISCVDVSNLEIRTPDKSKLKIISERAKRAGPGTDGCAICTGKLEFCEDGSCGCLVIDWVVYKCYPAKKGASRPRRG